jgi:hypothetical protein
MGPLTTTMVCRGMAMMRADNWVAGVGNWLTRQNMSEEDKKPEIDDRF